MMQSRRILAALIAAGMFYSCAPAQAVVISTATFQNGDANSYAGTFDRRMTATGAGNADGSTINTDVASYFIDGGSSALNDSGAQQGLIRFDNFVGGTTGVPASATIMSAKLEFTTNGSSNSQSGGAYNIYRLKTAFDSSSSYAAPFGGDGLAGDVDQILGSFDSPAQNTPISARVDKAVQGWVNGGTNLGFGIRSDRTTDGWSPHSTGSATVANRPKLIVDYTIDPTVVAKSYQQGIDGYTDTVDILLNDNGTGNTAIGSAINEDFLDGFDGAGSFDEPYLLRFNNIDLAYQQILKAELIIKTGFSSSAADTPGPYTVHQMLQDWDTTTTYASLDSDANPTLNDSTELLNAGVIGPAVSSITGVNDTEVVYVDITSIVENWRAGAPNYGVYIGAGTSNGWQIFFSGATDANFTPELRVVGVIPEPATLALGGLGLVGLATLALRRRK
jgi:hypothetical protein